MKINPHLEKLKSAFVKVSGRKVHYLFGGNPAEPTILILHGWASRAEIFAHLGQHLAQDHYVLIPDLPGCGLTPTLEQANFPALALFALDFLNELKISSVSIVAHSMGGGIGVEMGILDPKKVKQLLLLSSALDPIERSLWGWVVINYNFARKVLSPAVFFQLVKVFLTLLQNFLFHPVWTSKTFYLSTRSDLLADLKKIKITPTVICATDEDEFLPAINRVCRILAIEPTLIKGPGHNWPVLESHQACEIIEQYI